MRAISCSMVALALAMLGAGPGPDEAATKVDLEGRWKVVVLAFGDDEFLILDVKAGQDGPRATVVDAQAFLQNPQVAKLAREGGTVTLGLKQGGADLTFVGTRDARAADPAGARFLGTFQFRGATYPARLERTDAAKVGALSRTDAIPQGVAAAQRQPDPKARVEALRTVVREAKGHPAAASAYAALLQGAEAAGLTQEEVRGLVADWRAEAQPYGPSWAGEVQSNALTALAGKKAYAALTLELAQEADRALGESVPLERRAAVARVLADAARAAGRDELAATAATKADQLEARLDDEYRATVPPFRPEPVAARADGKGDRVVLMELFTGAQCPPCVAADVAFDALIHSYRPTELVTLQYHLHIPGPDPLTGPAALARGDYYDVHSTPTTLFNGQPEARGGGGMANAEAKYHQYREVIAGRLDGKKAASIALTARRQGDAIRISASAEATPGGGAAAPDDRRSPSSKLRLRLALVEDEIRYVGGNRLRFHHHVVRSLPGGAEGKELADGKGQVDATVNLADVRKEIEGYLDEFQKTGRFPNPLPAIALKDLAVVAFVQDDGDKSVLHAVVVPVDEEK